MPALYSGSAVPSTTHSRASGTCARNALKRRPKVFGVAEMGAHARPQLRLIDELVRMGPMLKGRLRAEQERVHIGGRAPPHELPRKLQLVIKKRHMACAR